LEKKKGGGEREKNIWISTVRREEKREKEESQIKMIK